MYEEARMLFKGETTWLERLFNISIKDDLHPRLMLKEKYKKSTNIVRETATNSNFVTICTL